MDTRRCPKCTLTKQRKEFYKDAKRPDGLYPYCRECTKARMREYVFTQPEEVRARRTKRLKELYSNPEYRAKRLEQIRAYRRTPEGIAKRKEESRLYNLNNRQAKTLYTIAYRARKANAKGFATLDKIRAKVEYYGGKCWICSAPYREIDHVIPLTKGGTNWPANLKPICRSCNARKSNTWPFKPEVTSPGGGIVSPSN